MILGDTTFTRGADAFFGTFDRSARKHAVGADVEIVRGAPAAQSRGTIQCALELLPEPLRPHRTVCV